MARNINAELDAIVKKLDAAEKEYEEKLKSTDLTQILNAEEIRKQGSSK